MGHVLCKPVYPLPLPPSALTYPMNTTLLALSEEVASLSSVSAGCQNSVSDLLGHRQERRGFSYDYRSADVGSAIEY
jgi:hypothetical protein